MPGIRFSEKLTGFFLEDTDDPGRGYEVGKKRGNKIEVRVKAIMIDDLDAFINDPNHQARLECVIDYGDLGKDLPTTNGVWNLFKLDPGTDTRKLIYTFQFSSKGGQPYLFYGEKRVHKDASFIMMPKDIKEDLTTLFTVIYHGDTKERPAGAGILKFKINKILELFSSLEVTGAANESEKKETIAKFIKFVNRELEATYGGPGIDIFDILKLLRLI